MDRRYNAYHRLSFQSRTVWRHVWAWTESFRAVRAFAEEHSRLPRWAASSEEEKILYTWIRAQQMRLKKGRLDQREENLLNYLFTRYGKKKKP